MIETYEDLMDIIGEILADGYESHPATLDNVDYVHAIIAEIAESEGMNLEDLMEMYQNG